MDRNLLKVAEILKAQNSTLELILKSEREFVREYLNVKGYSPETRKAIRNRTIQASYDLYKDLTVEEIITRFRTFSFALVDITPTGMNGIYIASWDPESPHYNPEYHANPHEYIKSLPKEEDE